jgi:hypothetical protein
VTFEEENNSGPVTVLSTACRTWEKVDELRYAGLPTDEFDFAFGKQGATKVTIPGLRATLIKV